MAHDKQMKGHAAGFSLLELTAALFVITVGLFGAMQMYFHGAAKLRAVNQSALAMRSVENELETLRALPFDELDDATERSFVTDTSEIVELLGAQASVTIQDYDETTLPLKQISAIVEWRGENGRLIRKSVTTLVGKRGGE